MGVALSILNMMTEANWEELWPAFQNALIGLGASAIAYLKREAIARGLESVAVKMSDAVDWTAGLGGDIDVSGSVQDESSTPFGDYSIPTGLNDSELALNDTTGMFLRTEDPEWLAEFSKKEPTVKLPRVGRGSTKEGKTDWKPPFKAPPGLTDWAIKAATTVEAMKRIAGLLPPNAGSRMLKYVRPFENVVLSVTRSRDMHEFVIGANSARWILNSLRADWYVLSSENWHVVDNGKKYAVSARHFVEVAGKMLSQLLDIVAKYESGG